MVIYHFIFFFKNLDPDSASRRPLNPDPKQYNKPYEKEKTPLPVQR